MENIVPSDSILHAFGGVERDNVSIWKVGGGDGTRIFGVCLYGWATT